MLDAFADGGYLLMLVPLVFAGALVGVGQVLWAVLRHNREADPLTSAWILAGGIGGAVAIWLALGLMLGLGGAIIE